MIYIYIYIFALCGLIYQTTLPKDYPYIAENTGLVHGHNALPSRHPRLKCLVLRLLRHPWMLGGKVGWMNGKMM